MFNKDGCYINVNGTVYNYGDTAIDWPSNGATGTLTWNLKNIMLGASKKITVFFKTNLNSCDESNLTTEFYGNWCTNCTDSCTGCAESNHVNGKVKIPHSYALVTIDNATFSLCGEGFVSMKVENQGTTHDYNMELTVDIPKYVKYKSGSGKYTFNNGTEVNLEDPDITSITSGDYAGGYELKWDKNKISEFEDIAPNDVFDIHFELEPDTNEQNPTCEFVKNGYKKIKAYADFAKPCNVNNNTERSAEYEKSFDAKAPDISVTKKTIEVDGNSYTSNSHYFPIELGSTVTFQIDVTNNGNLDTVKTNIADILRGSSQHPLDYVSAQYSYDGGSWTDVPWDTADLTNGIYIWNNVENDLGNGIEPGKTLKIKLKAQVDSGCDGVDTGYNYTEVWTGCSALPDMASDGSNLKGSATGVSGWNGSLSADCPIYQAKYARVASHTDSWGVIYLNNIPNQIHTCNRDVQFEIGFKNGEVYQGATTIYGPISLYDVLPRGANYVSGSTEFLLPGSSVWTSGSDPDISTVNWNTSSNSNYNGSFTELEWNSTNNSTLESIDISPTQEIRVRFKVNLDCSVQDSDINRQRLSGHDCSGNYTYYFPAGNEQSRDWWEKDHWNYSPDHPWIKEIDFLKPNVTIGKSVDKAAASPGDTLLYEIHIKNTGDGSSDVFSLTDTIPSGVALIPQSITDGPPPGWGSSYDWMEHKYDSGTGTITWFSSNAGIAYDDVTQDVYQVDSSDICLTDRSATVGTAYKNDGSDILRHTANNAVYDDVDNSGDVSSGDILLAGSKEPAGTPFVGTDSLRHSGTSVYDDVDGNGTVSSGDILIAGSAVSDGTSYDAGPDVLKHTEHGLPAGAETTVSFRVVVNENNFNTLSNCATFTSDCCYLNGIEACAKLVADLSITKTDNPDPVTAGETTLTYMITVTNNGPSDALNVTINDNVPNELQNPEYSTDNGSTWNNWAGSLNIGTLANGSHYQILIKGKVKPSAIDTIENTASVSSDTNDPDTSNNSATEDTTVNTSADLSITKTCHDIAAGVVNQHLYTVIVENNGPSDALNVTLKDILSSYISDATYVLDGSSSHSWPSSNEISLGTISSGSSSTIDIYGTIAVNAPESISNTASVSSTVSDLNNSNNSATCSNTVFHDADLSLTKSAHRISEPGEIVKAEFTIIVTNNGPGMATNVKVKDQIPSGYHYLSYTASQGVYNPSTSIWNVGDILPNEHAVLKISTAVLYTGDHTNTAEIIASDQPDPNSTPNNHNPNEDDQASASIAFPIGGTVYPVNKFSIIFYWFLLLISIFVLVLFVLKKYITHGKRGSA